MALYILYICTLYVCIPMFQVNWKHVSIRYTVGNNHCGKGDATHFHAPRLVQCAPVNVNMPRSCTSETSSYAALHIHNINMIVCYTATLRRNLLINSNLFYHYRYCRSQWYCIGIQSSYCGVMYTVPVQATWYHPSRPGVLDPYCTA